MTENKLQWGKTPWDGMTQTELVRECQRMYAGIAVTHLCHSKSLRRMYDGGTQTATATTQSKRPNRKHGLSIFTPAQRWAGFLLRIVAISLQSLLGIDIIYTIVYNIYNKPERPRHRRKRDEHIYFENLHSSTRRTKT